MNTNMKDLDVFQKSSRPCALDESSRSSFEIISWPMEILSK